MRRAGSRPRSPTGSTSCRGIRAAPASPARSVDCIDGAEYDRFYAEPDLTPDDDAERQANIDIARGVRRAVRRASRPPHLDRHEQHRSRSRRDPSGARRDRSSRTSGSATAANSVACGRRCSRPPCAPRCSTVRPTRRRRRSSATQGPVGRVRGRTRHLPRRMQRRQRLRVPQRRRRGGSVRRADGATRRPRRCRAPTAERRCPATWRPPRWCSRCTPTSTGRLSNERSRTRPAATVRGCSQLSDAYYRRNADGTYSNLIESFQAISCMDQPDRPTVEESDADAAQLVGVAPRLFPYDDGFVQLHVLPTVARPTRGDHRHRGRPDRRDRNDGRPEHAAREQPGDGRLARGRTVRDRRRQPTHRLRRQSCVNDIVEEYLVNLVAPRRRNRPARTTVGCGTSPVASRTEGCQSGRMGQSRKLLRSSGPPWVRIPRLPPPRGRAPVPGTDARPSVVRSRRV